jgi:glycine cleavage system H protein
MPKPLIFLMGRSPAFLPVDRRYARNHMWAAATEKGCRFGFSAYAVRLLGEIRCLEWSVEAGSVVEPGATIGFVEASKATSDLYAPIGGRIEEFNDGVLARPSLINTDLYDSGWLLAIAGDGQALLSSQEYLAHLEATWPLAQRLLKGQVNTEHRV